MSTALTQRRTAAEPAHSEPPQPGSTRGGREESRRERGTERTGSESRPDVSAGTLGVRMHGKPPAFSCWRRSEAPCGGRLRVRAGARLSRPARKVRSGTGQQPACVRPRVLPAAGPGHGVERRRPHKTPQLQFGSRSSRRSRHSRYRSRLQVQARAYGDTVSNPEPAQYGGFVTFARSYCAGYDPIGAVLQSTLLHGFDKLVLVAHYVGNLRGESLCRLAPTASGLAAGPRTQPQPADRIRRATQRYRYAVPNGDYEYEIPMADAERLFVDGYRSSSYVREICTRYAISPVDGSRCRNPRCDRAIQQGPGSRGGRPRLTCSTRCRQALRRSRG